MTTFRRTWGLAPGIFALALAGLFAAASGCDRTENNQPPAEVFAFPSALRAHSYGAGGPNLLFVLNSNFDLALSGGSLTVLDIDLAEELGAICAGAGGPGGPCLVPTAQGTPRILHIAVMNPLDAVRVSSYARDLAISADGLDLYAPSGGDDSLTWVEVNPDLAVSTRTSGAGVLSCFELTEEILEIQRNNFMAVSPFGDIIDADLFTVPACDNRHRPRPKLADELAEEDPACLGFDPAPLVHMPTAPFTVALSTDGRLAHVTHIDSGALSVFRLREDDEGRAEYLASFDSVDFSNGIAAHPPTGLIYVTGRSPAGASTGTRVAVFETTAMADDPGPFLPPAEVPKGEEAPPQLSPILTSVAISPDAGHDIRGLAFSSDGSRAFVVERSGGGDLLLILDTTGALGGDFNMPPLGVIAVGQGAQNVVVVGGAAAGGGDLVFVTCFTDDTVYVIDDQLGEVVKIVDVDPGPFGMALWTPAGETAPVRLFVSSFSAATLTALDVRPGPGVGNPLYVIGPPVVDQ